MELKNRGHLDHHKYPRRIRNRASLSSARAHSTNYLTANIMTISKGMRVVKEKEENTDLQL